MYINEIFQFLSLSKGRKNNSIFPVPELVEGKKKRALHFSRLFALRRGRLKKMGRAFLISLRQAQGPLHLILFLKSFVMVRSLSLSKGKKSSLFSFAASSRCEEGG
jgi:hypothetical protein